MPGTQDAHSELLTSLRRLPDEELVARLKSLTARERQATALLVAHLAELDTRDVYLRAGYSSLFTYCRDFLAFSDDEAYSRVVAARTARRFPVVLDLLAAGELNVTVVRLLGPHLTAGNHLGVLESARGKRKAQVEEIVARLSPRPDVGASLRRFPQKNETPAAVCASRPSAQIAAAAPAAGSSALAGGCSPSASAPDGVAVAPLVAPDLPATPARQVTPAADSGAASCLPLPRARRSSTVTPLSPDRYRYQLTIGGTTLEKLRLAKDMLRHALPSGDDETILDRALTALLVDLARKKFGVERKTGPCGRGTGSSGQGTSPCARGTGPSCKPRHASSDIEEAGSRRIPAAVKRGVWLRDLGRCTFVSTDGRRCAERAFLEFHHVQPYAVGGRPTVENLQLRCGPHNRFAARQYFARERGDEDQVVTSAVGGGTTGPTRTVPERIAAGRARAPSRSWELPSAFRPAATLESADRA